MKITTRYYGPVALMDLSGKLTLGKGDVALRGRLLELLDEGIKNIIINLKELKVMDSSGLGELIRCRTTCSQHGAELKLLNLTPKVYDLLEVTRLIGVFEIYTEEAEAIPSFWHEESAPKEKDDG